MSTKQKPIEDKQKIKRRKLNPMLWENCQFAKEDSKTGSKELHTGRKQQDGNSSITILNVNELNFPIKRHKVADQIKHKI